MAALSGMGLRVLLIRKDFKQWAICPRTQSAFESLVNTEGFQTKQRRIYSCKPFESLVNTEGFQTIKRSYVIVTCLRVLRRLSTTDSMSIWRNPEKKRCCLSFSIEKRVRPELRGCQIDVKKYALLDTDFISKTHSVQDEMFCLHSRRRRWKHLKSIQSILRRKIAYDIMLAGKKELKCL